MADVLMGNTLEAEVLIVGAGLAGAVAGYLFRQVGADVLAMEMRDAYAKDKLCAGLTGSDIVCSLDSMYVSGSVDALSPLQISEALYVVNGQEARREVDLCAFPRKRLDDYCLSRYLEVGGRLIDCMKLRCIDEASKTAVFGNLRNGGEVEVRYGVLVGADGASSAVRRLLGGSAQRATLALEGPVPLVRNELVMQFVPFVSGYCWYIPRGEDATVGVGVFNKLEGRSVLKDWLASFCEWLGVEMPPLRGALVPQVGDIALRAGEEAYLIGDAAGLVNGMGGGIHLAIQSAQCLADSIRTARSYEQAMEPMVETLKREADKLHLAYLGRCLSVLP